ncbi:D-glycero-alpha-D-manno-heptose-1,7-bisphosphate 7-phosphatase [Runella slithyformis]|uniref:D,D-heptose 1,7-bisphosphate phosphatase n=1 Tax=Runella slithyformis (strain ATCC 29530 / DSM 19594 / LMG 11500 / NCIMB 11436 / LSU 4) TaxID=761193 RepID=A0A7U4E6Y4_RUNSL|nr:HAD family hydrolase [Runella slithyformis]AEI50096.1 histidinol-phosphate phosphatase family protein [Runella slithyformis DSM 19594]
MKKKCVFLDRDGVLNQDMDGYLYLAEEMIIPDGVVEGLQKMKEAGYLLIVVTNQAGIAKGLYSKEEVLNCHRHFQHQCGHLLDDLYFCSHHPDFDSCSLMRKPESLMLEKAIAKYDIDVMSSWMVGDRPRDMQAGKRVGVRTIHLTSTPEKSVGDAFASNFLEATQLVVKS